MSVTAVDYLESQLALERQARHAMPYDPNECTFLKGELRQPLYACLTCSHANNTPVGVCYLCLIQCHATHDLVELFTKRNFTCDCGTTKMAKSDVGACRLRQGSPPSTRLAFRDVYSAPEDIPSLSNTYNQNFHGLFCVCSKEYNPLEESATMHQCYLGDVCGEDWYHEDCILGYEPGFIMSKRYVGGENKLDDLGSPGGEANNEAEETTRGEESEELTKEESEAVKELEVKESEAVKESEVKESEVVKEEPEAEDVASPDDNSHIIGPHIPNTDDFDQYVCWRCVSAHKNVFEELAQDPSVVLKTVPRFENVKTRTEWEERLARWKEHSHVGEPPAKKARLESPPISVFLAPGFKDSLKTNKFSADTHKFLASHAFFVDDDIVHQPPPDTDLESSTGSLLDLGTEALSSLPREQAIEGLQAYDKIRSKLRDFFKPFAEEGKVVTEHEVRSFFSKIKEED